MIADNINLLYKGVVEFKIAYHKIDKLLNYKAVIKLLIVEYINYSIEVYKINKITYESALLENYIKELHEKILYTLRCNKNELDINASSYLYSILLDINDLVVHEYTEFFDYLSFRINTYKYCQGTNLHLRIESDVSNYFSDIIEQSILDVLETI